MQSNYLELIGNWHALIPNFSHHCYERKKERNNQGPYGQREEEDGDGLEQRQEAFQVSL